MCGPMIVDLPVRGSKVMKITIRLDLLPGPYHRIIE